jgi:hypothetical protein
MSDDSVFRTSRMFEDSELPKRRASDRQTLNIEDMIANENDPKQRAFLIVLNSINNSLLANTSTIREVSTKLETHLTLFESHAEAEEALMNKGRGAWTVLAWVLGILQVAGFGLWSLARNDLAEIHSSLSALASSDTDMNHRLGLIEQIENIAHGNLINPSNNSNGKNK